MTARYLWYSASSKSRCWHSKHTQLASSNMIYYNVGTSRQITENKYFTSDALWSKLVTNQQATHSFWNSNESIVVQRYRVGFGLGKLCQYLGKWSLIARFMGPTWGPSGADRTQVGPMLAPWYLLSGVLLLLWSWGNQQLWYWLYFRIRIPMSFSPTRKDFNNLCLFSVKKWYFVQIHLYYYQTHHI